MGGRGSGSNMSSSTSGGNRREYTNPNGYFQTLTGVEEYSRRDLTSAVDRAPFTQVDEDEWRIGVNAGPENTTATNYGITESVKIYGPKSLFGGDGYRVRGEYYDRSFNNITAARNAARAQLKRQLGDTYDLRTRNRR